MKIFRGFIRGGSRAQGELRGVRPSLPLSTQCILYMHSGAGVQKASHFSSLQENVNANGTLHRGLGYILCRTTRAGDLDLTAQV